MSGGGGGGWPWASCGWGSKDGCALSGREELETRGWLATLLPFQGRGPALWGSLLAGGGDRSHPEVLDSGKVG